MAYWDSTSYRSRHPLRMRTCMRRRHFLLPAWTTSLPPPCQTSRTPQSRPWTLSRPSVRINLSPPILTRLPLVSCIAKCFIFIVLLPSTPHNSHIIQKLRMLLPRATFLVNAYYMFRSHTFHTKHCTEKLSEGGSICMQKMKRPQLLHIFLQLDIILQIPRGTVGA